MDTPSWTSCWAADTPLSFSDWLSTITSSTVYSSPPISTVGAMELAYSMPSTSFLPPAPFAPEEGSYTPILTTFSPLSPLPSPSPPLLPLPQATRLNAMARVSKSANTFFISNSS